MSMLFVTQIVNMNTYTVIGLKLAIDIPKYVAECLKELKSDSWDSSSHGDWLVHVLSPVAVGLFELKNPS